MAGGRIYTLNVSNRLLLPPMLDVPSGFYVLAILILARRCRNLQGLLMVWEFAILLIVK
jgi:hypothetical protein